MVTGGQKPPPELGAIPKPGGGSSSGNMSMVVGGGGGGVGGGGGEGQPLPSGATIIQQRNRKKSALENITKECNLKPDSIKKSYKKFLVINKDKSGLVDYTEFYEILDIDSGPVVESAFNCYDHDKIGQIDMKEVCVLCVLYGYL